jgi:preprotein translocase subunit SecA
MFGQLMDAIDDDYLRYVLHVEAIVNPTVEPDLARAVYEAADDPVAGTLALTSQLLADRGAEVDPTVDALNVAAPPSGNGAGGSQRAAQPLAGDEQTMVPTVKAPHEKIGRNEPCWCGSGKKFKLCHGAA